MCLAVYCPAGCAIGFDVISTALENNPDGAGYAIQTGAGLRIRRFGPTVTPGQFTDSWESAQRANPAGGAILHFRWATLGEVSRSMSHPFRVGRFALAHNGHIAGLRTLPGESDTAAYARIVAPAILHSGRNFSRKVAARALEISAGAGNKLLALPIWGPAIIAGESAGYWKEGAWFSNSSGHYLETGWAVAQSSPPQLDSWGYPTLETIKASLPLGNSAQGWKGV